MGIERLKPADTPDYMMDAWLGCVMFAIQTPEVVQQFRAQTGNEWTPGRSGIERMIDEATGADLAFVEQFIQWVNVNLWGPIDGPPHEESK